MGKRIGGKTNVLLVHLPFKWIHRQNELFRLDEKKKQNYGYNINILHRRLLQFEYLFLFSYAIARCIACTKSYKGSDFPFTV